MNSSARQPICERTSLLITIRSVFFKFDSSLCFRVYFFVYDIHFYRKNKYSCLIKFGGEGKRRVLEKENTEITESQKSGIRQLSPFYVESLLASPHKPCQGVQNKYPSQRRKQRFDRIGSLPYPEMDLDLSLLRRSSSCFKLKEKAHRFNGRFATWGYSINRSWFLVHNFNLSIRGYPPEY